MRLVPPRAGRGQNQSLACRAVVFNKEIEMEINQQKKVKVNAKTLRIYCKVSD